MYLKLISIVAVVMIGGSVFAAGPEIKNSQKIAILAGQNFDMWSWSPSGYARILTDELAKAGVKDFPLLFLENQKTAQMLANVDSEVIAKKPVYALIIPGTADYNFWAESSVSESFKANLSAVIGKLKAAKIPTAIATSYAVNSNPQAPQNKNVSAHNDVIRALAQEQGLVLIDMVKLVDEAGKTAAMDGSPVAKCVVNQILAAEVLRLLGFDEKKIAACREAWLDLPRAIQLMPSVSVNTYEKLKTAAAASGKDVGSYMTEVVRKSAE